MLGFDAVATGHHARIGSRDGRRRAARAAPTGPRTRATSCTCSTSARWPARCSRSGDSRQGRGAGDGRRARPAHGAKPDSQDVCFITSTGGRREFLGRRIPFHPADGRRHRRARASGAVDAVELVTVGQRRGLGLPGGGPKRYVRRRRPGDATVVVGAEADLLRDELAVRRRRRGSTSRSTGDVLVQCSAHGAAGRRRSLPSTDGGRPSRGTSRSGASPPARASSSTTATDTFVLGGGHAV